MTTSQVATAAPATQPKFRISGNSIEEVARMFAELVAKTEEVSVVDAKKGNGKYGLWELAGGDGLTLQGKELALEAGIPLYLGMTVVYRKLTDPARYDIERAQAVTKQAATIDRLKARIALLEGKGA